MKNVLIVLSTAGGILSACGPDTTTDAQEYGQSTQPALTKPVMCLPPVVNVDARRSLTVTDHNILIPAVGGRDFSLQRVLTQLSDQNGVGGPSALSMFRQFWDTQNPSPGLGLGPNCTQSNGLPSVVNGFDYGCRSVEGAQALNAPATGLASYQAVGLVNRFDLAPKDGSNCGEYRIVFDNGQPGRAFIIMEAVLPNPNPSCGIAACRPIQDMWADLSLQSNPAKRAETLEQFYFDGIAGFEPVVHFTHFLNNGTSCGYGCSAPGRTGQFRTNAFLDRPWMLKEFKFRRSCRRVAIAPSETVSGSVSAFTATPVTRTICDLDFVPVSVKDNPVPGFFSSTPPSVLTGVGVNFSSHFARQVACLAVNDVNRFGYCSLDNVFNHNESGVDFGASDYPFVFAGPNGSQPVRTAVQNALNGIGSSLTPDNIVARAEAISCKGCHQHSNFDDLGGGIQFPPSAGFVHNTEFPEAGPDGQRFTISSALTGTFLPFRKGIMEAFLSRSACVSCGPVIMPLTQASKAAAGTAPATTISGARAIH